jgi:hypothetical protein
MPRTRVVIIAHKHGPVFDGRWAPELRTYINEAKREIAVLGLRQIQARDDAVFKHPTGNYQSHLGIDVMPAMNQLITDHGIVYGPWLEGTSQRNHSTRFKGYHTFRYVFQRLRKAATPVMQAKLDKLVARWNA